MQHARSSFTQTPSFCLPAPADANATPPPAEAFEQCAGARPPNMAALFSACFLGAVRQRRLLARHNWGRNGNPWQLMQGLNHVLFFFFAKAAEQVAVSAARDTSAHLFCQLQAALCWRWPVTTTKLSMLQEAAHHLLVTPLSSLSLLWFCLFTCVLLWPWLF